MLIHILTIGTGPVRFVGTLVKEGTRMSEELSALTATKQAKNVIARCMSCREKTKVTVNVRAHDRYFWFDHPLEEVWPTMTEAQARVLIADKNYHFGHGEGHNSYECKKCQDLRMRLWRMHINEEAENERL